ncbi:MAG: hypothetical protein AVO34_05935 [Firmicutes bacterium ML8_F2]|nr:MAG: hypothetical protein AVO34_05935 [Firmicutes bacterium ML8_F2]
MLTYTENQNSVKDRKIFRDWYVISTCSGSEEKIKSSIEQLFGDKYALYLPRRELWHTINGKSKKIVRALFPGYILMAS